MNVPLMLPGKKFGNSLSSEYCFGQFYQKKKLVFEKYIDPDHIAHA